MVLASPAAKRLAREHGVDLSLVMGSGPEGRIVEEDVRRFLEETRGITPKVKEIIPLRGLKKTSAERVSKSFRTAPHSTVTMEVDVSYTAILVKVAVEALKEQPIINSTLKTTR